MSVFCLHSLKAAFLCQNSSVKRRNKHSGLGGYCKCLPGESLKAEQQEELSEETEMPLASEFEVEGAALQHLLHIQTLKRCV